MWGFWANRISHIHSERRVWDSLGGKSRLSMCCASTLVQVCVRTGGGRVEAVRDGLLWVHARAFVALERRVKTNVRPHHEPNRRAKLSHRKEPAG